MSLCVYAQEKKSESEFECETVDKSMECVRVSGLYRLTKYMSVSQCECVSVCVSLTQ